MRTYRTVWTVTTALVTAPCVVLEAVTGGWARLALLVPTTLLFGGLLGFVFADDRPDRWTWARRGAGWLCMGTAMADGLVATLGGVGALAGVVLALTSPVVVAVIIRQYPALTERRTAGPPESLSTHGLLHRWDRTTGEVLRCTSATRMLALTEERRALLDELQRRDPVHFDQWWATSVPDRSGR
jgi:hypothetical protein